MSATFFLLLLGVVQPLRPEDELTWQKELYLHHDGEGSVRSVMDYGPTRWFFLQPFLLFPTPPTASPFSELHPPRRPVTTTLSELVEVGDGAVGFSSPLLLFGPVELVGGISSIETPRSTTPFSAAWHSPAGTRLSTGRSGSFRQGVSVTYGALSLHHWRSEESRRNVAVLSRWGPTDRSGPIRLPLELIVSEASLIEPVDQLSESWSLPEPPVLSATVYHAAVRLGLRLPAAETLALLALSASPLDPPGIAALSATRAGGFGASLAVVSAGYLDEELRRVTPGLTGTIRRKLPSGTVNGLGGEVSFDADGSTGPREDGGNWEEATLQRGLGGPRIVALEGELLWRFHPRRGRFRSTLSAELERELEPGEGGWEVSLPWRPLLRIGSGSRGLTIVVPLGYTLRGELEPEDREWRGVEAGVELGVRLPRVAVDLSWGWSSAEEGEGETQSQEAAISVNLRPGNWQIGGSLSLGEGETVRMEELPEGLEGVFYLRHRGGLKAGE
ncbi:MAG: hypothetical protein ACOC45_04925 [Alkalispirochaetaceae bacterium]